MKTNYTHLPSKAYEKPSWGNITYTFGGGIEVTPVEVKESLGEQSSSDPRLIVTYNVTDDSLATLLYAYMAEMQLIGAEIFTKVEIDGLEVPIANLDSAEGKYPLSNGQHSIVYTLKDPTIIGLKTNMQADEVIKLGAVFYECISVTNIEIPNSVTSIGYLAFRDCSGLTSLVIPSNVMSMDEDAFRGCSSLTSVTIEEGVTSIGKTVFLDCSDLTSVIIPSSVTSIGDGAFGNCSSLTSISIPNSVTSIGDGAFRDCSGLTSVTIPSSVTSIRLIVFLNCSSLTSVTIPSSVTSIDIGAFNSCYALASITSLSTTSPTLGDDALTNLPQSGTLYVPQGATGYDAWLEQLGEGWTIVEQ